MEKQEFLVANFYRFVRIDNPIDLASFIKNILIENNIKGTVLIAQEGINCALAGLPEDLKLSISKIKTFNNFLEKVDIKFSNASNMPFSYLKVKIKKEIVTFKQKNIDPETKTGVMVNADEWNALISAPDTILIDTRNTYEVEIGTFKNAINPHTENFAEFADFVKEKLNPKIHKKIAMFCTGGIRCEKASSFLLENGFQEVFQLNGGILKYLEETPTKDSRWQGNCFVFDDRRVI